MKKLNIMLALLLLCTLFLSACKPDDTAPPSEDALPHEETLPDNTEPPSEETQPKIEINIGNNTTLYGNLGNTASIEFIVDGARYGNIENYTFDENKDCVKEINLAHRSSNPYTIGEYFDGWYTDNSLLSESGTATSIKVENNTTIQLYAQILNDTFDPSNDCISYELADKYGFDGYAISFSEEAFLELYPSGFFATSYKIPSTINGKKITVIEGFSEHYKTEHSLNNISFENLIIANSIVLIAENALKWSYNSITFLGNKPRIMTGNQNIFDVDP